MNLTHIGWMKEGKSDKVWGMILLQESVSAKSPFVNNHAYVIFWGRRGAKLQTKNIVCTFHESNVMFHKKQQKGYQAIDNNKLDEVYPEFQSDLEKTAFWAAFKV